MLFEGRRIGEDIATIRLVRHLQGLDGVIKNFVTGIDARAYGNLSARFNGANFHLAIRGVIWRGTNLAFEYHAQLAVVADDVLCLDTVDR